MHITLPRPVYLVQKALHDAGFEAYLVGGCVRDTIMERPLKDWDVATNAKPSEVQTLFPDHFCENDFGTVGVKMQKDADGSVGDGNDTSEKMVVEVTTYRTEFGYSDSRRPDRVEFVATLEEDLRRRDFTMNAIGVKIIAISQESSEESKQIICEAEITDPFFGSQDIHNKIIRAVGNPEERFEEDALRLMRAVRFFAELGFSIETETLDAIRNASSRIAHIAHERVRAEFERILMSDHPSEGIQMLQKTGLLHFIIPELEEGIGMTQNLHHTYTVWEHNLKALETCPSKKLEVRLAALLHDVAKPRTKRGEGKYATFYNHDHVGGRMTGAILRRMRFPQSVVEKAALLVDQHLFYYNVDEVTEAAVRRVIARVGLENIQDLIDVRIGDRLGSGVPKAKPYRLRHFEYMVEKVSKDPISVKQLKINGNDIMRNLSLPPGPKIGTILEVLLGEVIEDSSKNTKVFLMQRAQELSLQEVEALRETAKRRIALEQKAEEDMIKRKYWVQ